MAKKKRRILEEPEEEYEFTPTEFNEREFILKDIYGTKVFLVAMVLGLIVGILAAIICIHVESEFAWVIATALSFLVCGLMKKILQLMKFRPEMLEAKSLAGNYLLYLTLALGVCIVLVNSPFNTIL